MLENREKERLLLCEELCAVSPFYDEIALQFVTVKMKQKEDFREVFGGCPPSVPVARSSL